MAEPKVIDVDGEDVSTPADLPPVTLKIAGRSYEASCPKDAVWASVVASRSVEATGADQARVMYLFIGSALGGDQATELQRRLNDRADPVGLTHLARAYNALVNEWLPEVQTRFEALGMKFDTDLEASVTIGRAPAAPPAQEDPSPANRAGRRAAAKAAPATKAAKTGGVRKAGRADR